jgi:hypothetical protein
MFAQMFPCIPYLETLASNAETRVASRRAKIFPTKFRNIWWYTISPFADAGKTHTETLVRQIQISCATMFPSLSRAQRPRKHFESGGALAKRGTFVYDQNQTILCRSQAERNFLKIWSLYNVGNGLYRVFTAKEGVRSRNTFFVL